MRMPVPAAVGPGGRVGNEGPGPAEPALAADGPGPRAPALRGRVGEERPRALELEGKAEGEGAGPRELVPAAEGPRGKAGKEGKGPGPSNVPAPAAGWPEGKARDEGTGPRELAPTAEGPEGKAEGEEEPRPAPVSATMGPGGKAERGEAGARPPGRPAAGGLKSKAEEEGAKPATPAPEDVESEGEGGPKLSGPAPAAVRPEGRARERGRTGAAASAPRAGKGGKRTGAAAEAFPKGGAGGKGKEGAKPEPEEGGGRAKTIEEPGEGGRAASTPPKAEGEGPRAEKKDESGEATGDNKKVLRADRPVAETRGAGGQPGEPGAPRGGAKLSGPAEEAPRAAPSLERGLLPAKSNEFIVLHTIKQQEFTSSAQRARFKYSRVQANSNSSRNAPEARGNAQQTRRRVQTHREKNLFVVPLHDGVKGQTSAAFGKRRGAGIRQLPCHSISRAPSQQPRPHAIAALPMDVGHPS